MLKRPHYIAISSVVLLALVLLSLPSRTAYRVKLAVSSLFLPLFGLAGSMHGLTDAPVNVLRSRGELQAEIDRLRRENEQLRLNAVQMAEVAEENNRLRDAVGWKRQTKWQAKLAPVITRDPSNFWRTMHIGLGQRDGIRTNMVVVTAAEGYLVGRVNAVAYGWSQVVLVGDPNCRVSALVEGNLANPSKSVPPAGQGTINAGASSLDPTVVNLTHLDRQSSVGPGQRVVTSGVDGGIFPRGIPIGHIVDVSRVSHGVLLEARVKVIADLANLKEVSVLLQ